MELTKPFIYIRTMNESNEFVPVPPYIGSKLYIEYEDGTNEIIPYTGDMPYYNDTVDVAPIRKISVGAFRRRFTFPEKVAIEVSTDPMVKVLSTDLMASTFVDLDYSGTTEGIDYLISIGILTPERRAEMLADGVIQEV